MNWLIFYLISQTLWVNVWSWGSEKVLLRDLSAITLHQGQMTTGRRSSPVPQLKCVGGSAGCSSFVPRTVQCRNVGYDGYDVQWECKTDMDDSYRFGKIQVTCEGYDYPDDPYVLRGSCGLEYTIDLTEAGKSRSNDYGGGHTIHPSWNNNHESGGGWFIFLLIVFAVVYMICKMGSNGNGGHSGRHGPDPRYQGAQRPYPDNRPPPPGFKPEYAQPNPRHGPPTYEDATNYSTSSAHAHTHSQTPTGGGGFWSGLGLGGVAGYLFGSRRNHGYHHHSPGWGYGGGWSNWGNSGGYGNSWGGGNSWGSRGWGGSSWGNRGSSWTSGSTTYRGSRSSSSGTSRTSSGFGGTSRR